MQMNPILLRHLAWHQYIHLETVLLRTAKKPLTLWMYSYSYWCWCVSLSFWDKRLKPKQPFILPNSCIIDDQTRERNAEIHTAFFSVWQLAACVTLCVWLCVCVSMHSSVCVTQRAGRIPSVITCVSCHRANRKEDDDSEAVIGSGSQLASWQQPLWPTTVSSVSPVSICFLLHITTFPYVWWHHFKHLLTQHLCLQ